MALIDADHREEVGQALLVASWENRREEPVLLHHVRGLDPTFPTVRVRSSVDQSSRTIPADALEPERGWGRIGPSYPLSLPERL